MEPLHFFYRTILMVVASVLLVTGTGCSSVAVSGPGTQREPIRHVVFKDSESLRYLEPRARKLAVEYFPKIASTTLSKGPPPYRFDLVIGPIPSHARGMLWYSRTQLLINSEYLTNAPALEDVFDKVFIHEMAHFVIEMRRQWFPWHSPRTSETIESWGESLADYARFKVLGTNGWACPECTRVFTHHNDGYTCGGAFLLYLEGLYGRDFILKLVDCHRQRRSIERFVEQATGSSVDSLWERFLTTDSFTPGARASLALQDSLGFKSGRPPKDLLAQLRHLASIQTSPFLKKLFPEMIDASPSYYSGPRNWRSALSLYLYLDQPGGCAEQWLVSQRDAGQLPGFDSDVKFRFLTNFDFQQIDQPFPRDSTIVVEKLGNESHYHFQVHRESVSSDWVLKKAWRTHADGTELEDLAVVD